VIIEDEGELKERVRELTGRKIHGPVKIVEDTTDYMRIAGGMIMRLAGRDYFISGDAREGRFGIDDQPKFWVKYAYDLEDGARKIIKLVFYEDFYSRQGMFLVKASRSPEKEARCLELVKGHDRFMQGFSVKDPAGNLVRVIDFIKGKSHYVRLAELAMDHEEYFHTVFPEVIHEVYNSIEALKLFKQAGLHHGDIRNDHLIHDKETGLYRWIDFDYSVTYADYDILSCGNIITYSTARRIVSFKEVMQHPERFPDCAECSLTNDDGMLFYKYRVANLAKLYPYIPDKLNRVLMNFSQGTYIFYESYDDLLHDLGDAIADLTTTWQI